ncbi:hypothetical protein GOBAR_AA15282 [Gossypium barbadense]|uniref:Uncharacterized protein n=1 Tax=Gossypium barbadense TaxID=3634 RepID=A0A2P5XPW6_GOSBA|nr:hypothetical protein GOBAR_AA15282 [Gossypium barbadense]
MNKRKREELWVVEGGAVVGVRVWQAVSHGRVLLLSLLRSSCMDVHARVILSVLSTIDGHGCVFDRLAHGHVELPWQLIASCVKEKICPAFTRPCLFPWCEHNLRQAHVPGCVD